MAVETIASFDDLPASLLEKLTSIPVVPVVGGYSISSRFRSLADERHVQVVTAEEPN